MSSIGSNAFSPAVKPNETDVSRSNENQTELLSKNREKKTEEEEEKEEAAEIVKGPDGAIYMVQGRTKTLIQPAPSTEDQITF